MTTTTGDAAARRGPSWEECAELLDRLPLLPMAARDYCPLPAAEG